MTATVTIALRNNEDWRDGFVLADNTVVPPLPIDLTDCALTMHVRVKASDINAVFIASTANGKLDIITGSLFRANVTAGGTGYTSAPAVSFTGGGSDEDKVLPTAVAVLDGDAVESIVILERGRSMTEAPTVVFTGGGGDDAAATAVIGPSCAFDVDWAEIAHLSGSYFHDLALTLGDLRKVMWAGQFTVEEGVTK